MPILLWVAVLSLLSAAAAMGVIAWRAARGVRDQELARVELLKALAFPDDTSPPIFGERGQPLTTSPRWISLSAVGAAMALGVMIYAVLAGGLENASVTTPAAHATTAPAASATVDGRTTAVPDRPIEVIALQYEFGRATAFSVSGRVRNPAGGRALADLMAVVDLLDADGRILTSQMTPLERPVLEAGQTSTFSLVFPRVAGTVARYQVGFRLHGRDRIPQIDRRAPEPSAKAPTS